MEEKVIVRWSNLFQQEYRLIISEKLNAVDENKLPCKKTEFANEQLAKVKNFPLKKRVVQELKNPD